ncbi:MAG: hypothetical protein P4M08_00970 [Oligoflexia bacterium]|nr:hypothetical protein [Oligoflexia bacterium]
MDKLTLYGLMGVSLLTACGVVGLGSGASNVIAPSAPISASGNFLGTSYTGDVTIYHLGTESYEAYLSSFQAPSSNISGIVLRVTDVNGNIVLNQQLISSSGSTLYPFDTSTDGIQFATAQIYRLSPPTSLNQATLANTGK